ncbi:MAG: DUF721 domain-containing protein [Desulfobacteraceae bacterium]|nr:DUF721 domain-containing protein [Desulfobacteraceae bacterium]
MAAEASAGLGEVLESLFRKRDWQGRLRLHQVFIFWEEVVGAEIARHAQPQFIRGETLWVAVSDSVWMQHLQFEWRPLLDLINERLAAGGEGRSASLKELRFQLASGQISSPPPAQTPPRRGIDHHELARFSALLAGIEDPELREVMRRAWRACSS